MALEGMDVDQVTNVLNQINSFKGQVESQANALNAAVTGLNSSWVGADASQFQSNWTSEYYNPLHAAIDNLQGAMTTLQNNLTQQTTASSS